MLHALDLEGKETSFTIRTLNVVKKVRAHQVSLNISPIITDHDGVDFEAVHLQNVYAIDTFPAMTNSVTSAADVEDFDHLSSLPIPDVGHDKVTIIIGQDNSDILQPLELRTGRRGEPFAVRTLLGWAVNGPLSSALDSKSGTCNYICSEASLYDEEEDNVLSPARAYSVNDKKIYRFGRTLFRL